MSVEARPVRVLHVIDGLGGGGSERWLWEIVRFADPDTSHRVVTVFADPGSYAYASRLRERGIYRPMTPPAWLERLYAAVYGPRPLAGGPTRKAIGAVWLVASLTVASVEVWRANRSFRPTAIHAHGFMGYVLGLGTRMLTRQRLVHTVPCLVAQMIDAKAAWLPGLYRRSHRVVDRFFTSMPNEQIALGIPAGKLYEIPGAVDLDAVDAVERDRAEHRRRMRDGLGIPHAAFVLISVGRLHTSKGHEHAISALAGLGSDVHLIVLGDGPLATALAATVAKLDLEGRVHFAGYREDVLEHYVAADVYLRLATIEGDNLSSLLAMAIGLPVVGFDTRAETDLVPRVGHGVLVPVGDDSSVAEQIERLRADPGERTALELRGRAYARENLDVRRTISDYHRFYREASAVKARQ